MFKLRCSHRRNERTTTRGEKGRNQVLQQIVDKPKKKKKKKKGRKLPSPMRKPFIVEVDIEDDLTARKITQPYCISFFPIGWKTLVLQALDDSLAAGWNGQGLAQIKEKFGTLCIYIDGISAPDIDLAVDKILAHAEYLSKHTCQCCGKHDPDRVDVKFVAGATMCAECSKKALR